MSEARLAHVDLGAPPRAGADPRPVAALTVFLALLRRDLIVARRELGSFLLRTALQPLLTVMVFGYLLPSMGFTSRGYVGVLLPGILAISLAFASLQSVALPMMTDFGFTREIDDRLLAPVPIGLVPLEKVLSGMIQGMISALFVLPMARLIMGPIPGLSVDNLALVLGVTLLGSATFAALGLWLGTAIPPQQIGLMFSVILAPMIFFGCAYYPWAGLHRVPVMQVLVLVNPLVYVAESLRGAVTPSLPHMPLPASCGAMVVIALLLWWAGHRSFWKRAMS